MIDDFDLPARLVLLLFDHHFLVHLSHRKLLPRLAFNQGQEPIRLVESFVFVQILLTVIVERIEGLGTIDL